MTKFDNQSYDPSILDLDTDAYSTPGNSAKTGKRQAKDKPSAETEPQQALHEKDPEKTGVKKKPVETEPMESGPSIWRKIIDFFCDRRTHGAIGLLLIGFSAYVLIASLSFFVSGKKDVSAINQQTIEQLSQQPDSVENAAGPAGAVMSQVILTQSFGIGAMVMIIYLTTIGLALLRVIKIKFWSFTFKSLFIALTLSMVAGLLTYGMESHFLWGGLHGRMMNMLLIQRFGWTGAVIVSLLLVGVIAMIYLNELITLYKISRARMKAVKERREQARLEREKREQAVRENMSDKGVSDETDEQKSAVEEDETITSEEKKVVFDEHDAQEQKEMDDIAEQTDDEPVAEHEPKDDEALLDEMMNVHREKTDDTENVTLADESSEAMDDVTATDDEPAVKNEPGADKIDDEVPLEIIHNEIEQAESINNPFDPTAELSHYQFPPLDLLIDHPTDTTRNTVQEEDKERIIRSLREYGINITKIDATVGPTVTLFEIVPEEGTRIQQIKRLEDDLMRSLSAIGIRIVAPIPGKGTIGIEVPNKNPQTVGIRAVLSSKKYQEFKGELPMAMGATISNEVYVADLAKMPHLLVAGATGQGKSVGLNTIIASLIYRKHPSTLKFVLIDPKMVEFSLYSKLEHHYLAKMPDEDEPIITQTDRVISTLNSLCVEMENRYRQLKSAGVRNIKEYNDKFTARQLNPEKGHQFLPYIVVIIDEFADLISVLGKEVETPVARITAKARAVGIHMIIATQRPSIDVITGVIKNNIPGRIAFKVPQSIDSKTILDRTGANQLIGRGDMLFLNGSNLERVQCAFIDTPEVEAICNFIENETGFPTPYLLPDYNPNGANEGNAGAVTERDPLFAECARFIIQSGTASTSSLQRRYGIGYNRAGKIMDQMEAAGIVGPAMGSKPRQVLLDIIALERLLEDMGI